MIAWSLPHHIFKSSDNIKVLMAMALVVGLVTGVVAWLFIRALEIAPFWPAVPGQSHFFGITINRFLIVVIPAVGGLLAGLVLRYGTQAARGTGTADIMYALRRKGGHLSIRDTFFKALASLFTICAPAARQARKLPAVAIGAGARLRW